MTKCKTNYDVLIQRIDNLRIKIVIVKEQLIKSNPKLDPEKDVRITSFGKLINLINSTHLAFVLISQNSENDNFWQGVTKEPILPTDRITFLNNLEGFIGRGLIHFIYSVVESSFRVILRTIDSEACNRGTAKFKSIYECLFSKLSKIPSDAIELLDLLRLVRNTIHNNGVYFHRSFRNDRVAYKGKTYDFRIGEPVCFVEGEPAGFVPWDWNINIVNDVLNLLIQVVNDRAIAGIPEQITDPFA